MGTGQLVNKVSFSPDRQCVVTAFDDGTARLWKTCPDVAELFTLVVAELSRCLSTTQHEHFGPAVEEHCATAHLTSRFNSLTFMECRSRRGYHVAGYFTRRSHKCMHEKRVPNGACSRFI